MATPLTGVGSQAADERLRQERETFDQHRTHQNRWFLLRLAIGYMSVVLLPSILAVSTYILLNQTRFPTSVVTAAGGALFVDALGLIASVWKIVLNPDFMTKLAPMTTVTLAEVAGDDVAVALLTDVAQEDKDRLGELVILSAKYGTEGKSVDVTEFLRPKAAAGKLEMHVTNDNLGGDPVPKVRKALEVVYSYAGETHTKTVREGQMLSLP
jgi:hypothetical protein